MRIAIIQLNNSIAFAPCDIEFSIVSVDAPLTVYKYFVF